MSDKKKSWAISIATAIIGISITLFTANAFERTSKEHAQERFTALSDMMNLELQKRLQRFEVGLHNFEGLFRASHSVEYDEFGQMFSAIDLQNSYPGSLGIGFVTAIKNTPEETRDFHEQLIAQGAPDFDIHSVPQENRNTPEQQDDETLYVVKYIQPIETNEDTLGMNIASDAARRFAADQALQLRKPQLSECLKLVQSQHAESGFLYLLPIFKKATQSAEAEEFVGWVFMPIVVEHAVEGIEKNAGTELTFKIFEGDQALEKHLICSSRNSINEVHSDLVGKYSIDVGGQRWLLQTQPSFSYVNQYRSHANLIIVIGIILSFGCAWVVKRLASQATMAEEQARSMTAELHRLAMVAKRTTNAVVITDVNRRILWTNDAFSTITGFTAEEVIGKVPGHILQARETDSSTVLKIREALNQGKGFCGEILNQHKNGEKYWISLDIQPMHDEDGTHVGFMAIEIDVTASKNAAAQLATETQRTKLALDSGGLAIWDWDLQTDCLIVDDRWAQIIGPYDTEAGKFNKYWEDRIHPDDIAGYHTVVQRALTDGMVLGEWRYRNSNDKYVWVMVRGHVVERNEEQEPTKMVGTIMEITDRKLAEEALKASEARAKAMFERSSEAIFLFNESGFIDCNRATVELFGFETKQELLSHHPADLSPPTQPDGSKPEEAAKTKMEQIRREGFAQFDWIHRKHNGKEFVADVSLALIDRDRNLAMGILRDVSEKRELERQLSQAQKLESIGQLAAGVAHEINTPMQCVFSNIEYLQEAFDRVFKLTEVYRQLDRDNWSAETLALIEETEKRSKFDRVKGNISDATSESGEAARRVIEIVRAMKTMSHPGTTDKVSSDLNKLVQDAAVISRNRWKYVATLETHLDEELTGVPLLPAQLSQVMLNLIVNAADAVIEKLGKEPTELGLIELSTRRAEDGVIIEVADSGNGIPEHIQKRIFDPFFTTKEVGRGTGQGLAIAYDVIVNQHQGRIEVETEPGVGSRFMIWLPTTNRLPSPELTIVGEKNEA